MSIARRAIIRVSIAVCFAGLALDVLRIHSVLMLVAPVAGILSGVAYLHSTGGQR